MKRPIDMESGLRALQLAFVLVGLLLVAVGGCGPNAGSSLATPPPTTTPIEGTAAAGGPCLDENAEPVGDTSVAVLSGEQSVEVSLGYATITSCPGMMNDSATLMADGFFVTLDSAAVDFSPAGTFNVHAPGYLEATLEAAWSDEDGGFLSDAEPSLLGAATWEIVAPDTSGLNRLDMILDWPRGTASFAVLITTDGSANTRTTTSALPARGVSTDEAPIDDAPAPGAIFDNGAFERIVLADGAAYRGVVDGIDAVVFVCNGIQITASNASAPGLDSLLDQVTAQILDPQGCTPQFP